MQYIFAVTFGTLSRIKVSQNLGGESDPSGAQIPDRRHQRRRTEAHE